MKKQSIQPAKNRRNRRVVVDRSAIITQDRGTINDIACYFGVAVLLVAWLASETAAQTVMLPTFRTFSYSGSVMAPDGGTLTVGGVARSAEGSSARGVPGLGGIPGFGRGFRNQAIGRETGNSGLTIHPQILIMSELEEDHLAATGYGPEGRAEDQAEAAILAKARFLSENIGRHLPAGQSPSPSLPR